MQRPDRRCAGDVGLEVHRLTEQDGRGASGVAGVPLVREDEVLKRDQDHLAAFSRLVDQRFGLHRVEDVITGQVAVTEAGIEKTVPAKETVDGRPGVIIQIYHNFGYALKAQMLTRIGQCIMTCPTTSAFNALEAEKIKRLKIGRSLSFFGDGFQKRETLGDRKVWNVPVMEGSFIVEDLFAVKRGVAGGNFLILAKDQASGLASAEAAAQAIRKVDGAVLTFPGGICRSGSKIGSLKYKLTASTNHVFCPSIREQVKDTQVPAGVNSVYEIVVNGLNLDAVQKAVGAGVQAAASVPGV